MIRTNLLNFFFFWFLFISCTKPDNPPVPVTPNSDTGIIFYGGGNASTLTAYQLAEYKILWQVDQAYAWNTSIPVFEKNIIYTGNVYGLSAIDAISGKILWKKNFGDIAYRQSVGFAPANNPVISDSIIYLISYKGASDHSWLNAVHKLTGALLWEKDLSAGLPSPKWTYTTPAISGDRIYAISKDNSSNDRIFCLNKYSGAHIWLNTSLTGVDSYPLIYNDNLIIGNYGSLIHLNTSDGSLKFAGSIAPYSSDGIKPVLLDNNTLLYLGHNYGVYQSLRTFFLNPDNGTVAGNFDMNFEFQCTDKKSIFYSTYKSIKAIHPATHDLIWNWDSPFGKMVDSLPPGMSNINNSPIVSTDDAIYYHQASNIFGDTLSFRNSIFVIDKITGNLSREIKLDKKLSLNKFVVVKDNTPYYPSR